MEEESGRKEEGGERGGGGGRRGGRGREGGGDAGRGGRGGRGYCAAAWKQERVLAIAIEWSYTAYRSVKLLAT